MPNKYITFLIFLLGGFALLRYTRQTKQLTGSWGWAEQYLGPGGTYTAIKIFGLLSIILAFAYLTGHLQQILFWVLGPMLGSGNAN